MAQKVAKTNTGRLFRPTQYIYFVCTKFSTLCTPGIFFKTGGFSEVNLGLAVAHAAARRTRTRASTRSSAPQHVAHWP
jgi:hypothetical protein